MKSILFYSFLICSFYAQAQTPYKLDTMPDGDGIVVEKFKPKYRNNRNRFTENNSIYKANKKFLFDFHYSKEGVERGIVIEDLVGFTDNPDKFWHFCPIDSIGKEIATSLELTVSQGGGGVFDTDIDSEDYQQTVILWRYLNKNGKMLTNESTGLVENENNIWMHPPRSRFFAINEANPFPYIKTPYKIGTSWTWKLKFGSHWSNPAWLVWKGAVDADYAYKITEQKELETPIGKLMCWVVESVSTSRLGKTFLTSYFNEKYGFVQLNYTNIDGSKLFLNLKEVKN